MPTTPSDADTHANSDSDSHADSDARSIAVAAADTTDPRHGLAAIATLRRLTDALELAQVESALGAGLTWAEIATHLGVTRQAAHKKFARRVSPDLARHRK